MEDFQLVTPTNLICNRDIESEIAHYIKPFSQRILIVSSGDFIVNSVWYRNILDSLKCAGILFKEFRDVQSNPLLSGVRQGINLCRQYQLDFVLSIGGGSVIDTAKAIAAGCKYIGDVWELFTGTIPVTEALPVGTIMTIMSTGSEGSNGAVITNEETQQKHDIMSDALRPVFCLMNPEITYSVPEHQVHCGIVDMFSHVTERYFSPSLDVYVTDHLCEGLMKGIIQAADILKRDFFNYNARANLMLASVYAHNNIVGAGRIQDWATHTLGAPLSGRYNIIHAETISVLLPHWASYVSPYAPARFVSFARNVFNITNEGETEYNIALKGIQALTGFFQQLNMPLKLSDLGITQIQDLREIAKQATYRGNTGGIKSLNYEELLSILTMAL
ncbi:iron-containing alcohol dehydrogenase [Salmonella enterica subsp. arizonae]|nr:iron-containing alcohol dehydrogenase [Salmonella enterica subsp. arizonae]